jgi:imidazolonepropionase-like amidohydrolase
MKAVIDEAHRLGLPASGYPMLAGLGIEYGLDSIKHAHTLGRAYKADAAKREQLARQMKNPGDRSNDPRLCLLGDDYDDLIQTMLRHHVAFVPSMVKDFKSILPRRHEYEKQNIDLLSLPDLQYLPVGDLLPQLTASSTEGVRITPCGEFGTLEESGEEYKLLQRTYRNVEGFLSKFVKAGGRVLAGTAPHSFVLPGISLHHEMQLFVDAGLTPMQALQSAGLWGAEFIHAQKDVGSVETGKLADILILARNPLEDITHTRSIETVIQGGRILPMGYHISYSNPIPRSTRRTAPSGGYLPPIMQGLSPTVTTEGSPDLKLKVTGRRFAPKSVVVFGTTRVETGFVSETELAAVIPARLLRSVGTYWLHVFTPRPGGGDSENYPLIVKFK